MTLVMVKAFKIAKGKTRSALGLGTPAGRIWVCYLPLMPRHPGQGSEHRAAWTGRKSKHWILYPPW